MWSSLGSNIVAEVLAYAGYDWIVVDTEHAPSEPLEVLAQLQGLATGTAEPVVRVAWNDAVLMKRLLDIGARSLLVPFVQSAEEARAAVAATRYPPQGVRGVSVSHRANRFGRVRDYLQTAHQEICVLVQLETRAALDALEAIAAIEGVDGLFIGPSDLAADLGHLGNAAHPDVQAVIAERARASVPPASRPASWPRWRPTPGATSRWAFLTLPSAAMSASSLPAAPAWSRACARRSARRKSRPPSELHPTRTKGRDI